LAVDQVPIGLVVGVADADDSISPNGIVAA
jgi:hypothetical protein